MASPDRRVFSAANQAKVAEIETALEKIYDEALQRGWHGEAAVTLKIADGTIQQVQRYVREDGKPG